MNLFSKDDLKIIMKKDDFKPSLTVFNLRDYINHLFKAFRSEFGVKAYNGDLMLVKLPRNIDVELLKEHIQKEFPDGKFEFTVDGQKMIIKWR